MIAALSFIVLSFSLSDSLQLSAESGLSFFSWSVLHETSHAIAMSQAGFKDISIQPYPHMSDSGFMFASARGIPTSNNLSRQTNIKMLMAPRCVDLLAVIAFPLMANISPEKKKLLYPFVLGGLIDLVVGSIGRSSYSDIAQAFPNTRDRRIVGAIGISAVALSVTAWYLLQR